MAVGSTPAVVKNRWQHSISQYHICIYNDIHGMNMSSCLIRDALGWSHVMSECKGDDDTVMHSVGP